MGHSHDHHGGRQFYEEQLLTIGACGAFATVALVLWVTGALGIFLADKFHVWVLLGGAALLAMAVLNGVALWLSSGKAQPAHDHGPSHDHDHAHDHGDGHTHNHGHDHDHGSCDHNHDHDHLHAPGHDHVHSHAHPHEHAHAETAVQTGAVAAPSASGVRQDAPAAAAAPAPAHDHGHGHDGHDHGYAPWRYAVLLLPVAIYFVVPPDGLSAAGEKPIEVKESTALPVLGASMAGLLTSPLGQGPFLAASALMLGTDAANALSGVAMDKTISGITFQQLELDALYPENRRERAGKTVQLVGQYVPKDSRMFTLRRFKISCCAADAVPLNAVIMLDANAKETLDSGQLQFKWVQVTGRVEFLERPGGGYITALILTPDADWKLDDLVKVVPAPGNKYLN